MLHTSTKRAEHNECVSSRYLLWRWWRWKFGEERRTRSVLRKGDQIQSCWWSGSRCQTVTYRHMYRQMSYRYETAREIGSSTYSCITNIPLQRVRQAGSVYDRQRGVIICSIQYPRTYRRYTRVHILHTCTYTRAHIYTHAHIHAHAYRHVHTHIHGRTHIICVCVWAYTCICVCTCMCAIPHSDIK